MDGHAGCFRLLVIAKNVLRNIYVQTSLHHLAFNSFGYVPEVDRLDHMIFLFLIFEETAALFSTVSAPLEDTSTVSMMPWGENYPPIDDS